MIPLNAKQQKSSRLMNRINPEIMAIQEKYNISFEESMCFGDYLNDVTLIKSCGESYCMANGHPQLKELAKYITTSNDERGVMRVLEKL